MESTTISANATLAMLLRLHQASTTTCRLASLRIIRAEIMSHVQTSETPHQPCTAHGFGIRFGLPLRQHDRRRFTSPQRRHRQCFDPGLAYLELSRIEINLCPADLISPCVNSAKDGPGPAVSKIASHIPIPTVYSSESSSSSDKSEYHSMEPRTSYFSSATAFACASSFRLNCNLACINHGSARSMYPVREM